MAVVMSWLWRPWPCSPRLPQNAPGWSAGLRTAGCCPGRVVDVVDAVRVRSTVAGVRLVSGAVELLGLVVVGDRGHPCGVRVVAGTWPVDGAGPARPARTSASSMKIR